MTLTGFYKTLLAIIIGVLVGAILITCGGCNELEDCTTYAPMTEPVKVERDRFSVSKRYGLCRIYEDNKTGKEYLVCTYGNSIAVCKMNN